ncbi:traf6-b [Symbiodinium sp. CCMP2592]|nr:traf6-b [Symbiodinium sp. CCMP2592]
MSSQSLRRPESAHRTDAPGRDDQAMPDQGPAPMLVYLVEGETFGGMYRNAGAENGRPIFQRYEDPPACICFEGGWKVRLGTDDGTAQEHADTRSSLPPTGAWGPLQVSCRSSPFFVVDGATDNESVMNGRYACIGILNGRPKYKRLGSQAIIYYFDGKWRINSSDTWGWYFWHPNAEARMPPVGLWERYDHDDVPQGPPASLTLGTQFMRGDSTLIVQHPRQIDWSANPSGAGWVTWVEPGERRHVSQIRDAWYLHDGDDNLWVPFSAAVLEHTEGADAEPDEPVVVYRVRVNEQLSTTYVQDGMCNCKAFYQASGADAHLFFEDGWRLSTPALPGLTFFPDPDPEESSSGFFPPTGSWHSEGGETVSVSCRASPFFIVGGAGSDAQHSRVNGRYACVGIFMGKPKYKQVDGEGILYWRDYWKLNYTDGARVWYYAYYPDSDSSLPPTGTWTTFAYSNRLALPAPEVSIGRTEDYGVGDRVVFMRSGSLSYGPGCTAEVGQIREDGFFSPTGSETLWVPLSSVTLDHAHEDHEGDSQLQASEPSEGEGSHADVESSLEQDSATGGSGDEEDSEGSESEAAPADAFECGHDEDWTNPDEVERFKCPLCLMVARDALSHHCGGSLFCDECWTRCLVRDDKCPNCREDSSTVVPAHFERRSIRNLRINCPSGCGGTFTLTEKPTHLSDLCPLREVQCPDCGASMQANELAVHQEEHCSSRRILCSLCGEQVIGTDMMAHFESSPGKHFVALLAKVSSLEAEVTRLRAERGREEGTGVDL